MPFQDKREDIGHAEFVTYFAFVLNGFLKGDKNITIPAAILHDIGWCQMTKKELKQFYLPNWKDFEPKLRKKHQEEGVNLSEKILKEVNYPLQHISEILEIISEHDTRKGFFSKNDGIVRDADKLWRFTLPQSKIFLNKRGTKDNLYTKYLGYINQEGFFYSNISKEIAKKELEITLKNSVNL